MTTCLNLRRFILITMALICWRRHYQGKSLKFVVQSPGWQTPPHRWKGGDLLNFPPCGAHTINWCGWAFNWVGGKWEKERRKEADGKMKAERREEGAERKAREKERTREEKEKGRKVPIKLRSRVICGPIELKFCQRVSGSMFFNLIGWFVLGIFLPTFFVDVLVEPPFGEISLIFSFKGILCLD